MPPAYALARRWYAWQRPTRTTAAVALWHQNRLLLVSHSYKRGMALPGGGVHRRETPEHGAARELREETGIDIDPESLRLVDKSARDGRYGWRTTYVYEVRLLDAPPLQVNGWEVTGGMFVGAREARAHGRAIGLGRYIEGALAEGSA